MTMSNPARIRDLFSMARPIDRPIEKVIDYAASDGQRLLREVEEYEVTLNVEQNFRRFLDAFGQGVRTGQVTETGIWVSGFYGSGKSSFTKYLGFALDPDRKVGDRPFLDLLLERINATDVKSELRALAHTEPVAVIMLDLGSDQLASSATATVSNVLYWKVLRWAGYSKEEKLAHLELDLERDGKYDEFRAAYQARFGGSWEDVHDDPLTAVQHADQLMPRFYPTTFPEPGAFSKMRFSMAFDAKTQAARILDLVRRKSGRRNVLFLIDEAGQYVAPRGELILNLDGLARNLKELGQGRVWIVATGQQTLTEIVERATYNSAELNKLKDRFPIAIGLDAADIREITWKRLLTKSTDGTAALAALYAQHGQSLAGNTRLEGTPLFKSELDDQMFVRLYPFLPQHFSLLMELVRVLASSTGGIGLRSAIRVIQDVLVDTSKALPAGAVPLADRPVGTLVTIDSFYDTLRADIARNLPHVVAGVDRAAQLFPGDDSALSVAKAVAALQLIDKFPRTPGNLAALLYPTIGAAPHEEHIRGALRRLLDSKDLGLVDDPQTGGPTFLSDSLKPVIDARNRYQPSASEVAQFRNGVIAELFPTKPTTKLEATKTVNAGLHFGRAAIAYDGEDIEFRIEAVSAADREARRQALLEDTNGQAEWKLAIVWLITPQETAEDDIVQALRSRQVRNRLENTETNQELAQYVRSERTAEQSYRDRVKKQYQQALMDGIFIFRGAATPAGVAGASLIAAAQKVLGEAAAKVFPQYGLVNIHPSTDLAQKFLQVDKLDQMPEDRDPLRFVQTTSGNPRVNMQHRALAEARRALGTLLAATGGAGSTTGAKIQDHFAAPPYGWSKDATRYVFAALLVGGEIVLRVPDGQVKTTGPAAINALKNTQSFGPVGVSVRDGKPDNDALVRAASSLGQMLGQQVLPLEDRIARATRDNLTPIIEPLRLLPDRLRLLGLAGEVRAADLLTTAAMIGAEQGAGAIGILGATGSAFPASLAWARKVTEALAGDATQTIGETRRLLTVARDLARDFPKWPILSPADQRLTDEILGSDLFYERLPELRSLNGRIVAQARLKYHDVLTNYQADLLAMRNRLEARPDWTTLREEDRSEIAGRTECALPTTPPQGQELDALRRLLLLGLRVRELEEELRREVATRLPPLAEPPGDMPIIVALSSLTQTQVIRNADELHAWISALEARIMNSLDAGAPIRIEVQS